MTLRKKTLITIGVTLASLIIIQYTASRLILMSSFARLEEQEAREKVEQALNALSDNLSNLNMKCSDWAGWDDTYKFIEDVNPEYVNTNLVDTTFPQLRLNLILFINNSGEVVYGKGFDLNNRKENPVPASLQEHLQAGSPLLNHAGPESSLMGSILLPEGPMLFSARPIVTSELKGPIRGTLIMGRYLDSKEIEHLSETTRLLLTFHRSDDAQLPADIRVAISSLSEKVPILTHPLSDETIMGYTLIKDVYGKPGLLMRVIMPRVINSQGQATILYIILSLLAVGVVFIVVTLVLLERLVLSRLVHLSTSIRKIGANSDFSGRVSLEGRDELSDTAYEVNKMLESLEHSQQQLQESEENRFFSLLEELPAFIYLQAPDYTIRFANRYFLEYFGDPNERPCYEILERRQKPCKICHAFNVFDNKIPNSWEWTRFDGNTFQLYSYPFTDIDGAPLVLVMGVNITELKQYKKELARLDRLNLIGEMAASIGHEVRNPMTTVRGFLQLLRGKVETAKYGEYFDLMIDELDRANSIISEFLALAKDKAVDLSMQELNSVVANLLPLLQADAIVSDKIIQLELGEVPNLPLDEKEIRQLILNLVRNGLEAMTTGGKLTIKTFEGGGEIILAIQDQGKGIGSDVLEKLGTPFFTTKDNGTGLGLAVCYSIAARHNAKIDIETDSAGTTFYVKFKVGL